MADVYFITSGLSIVLSVIALIFAMTAIAFVVGLKNSTHQIQWKLWDPKKNTEVDPSALEGNDETINPSIEDLNDFGGF